MNKLSPKSGKTPTSEKKSSTKGSKTFRLTFQLTKHKNEQGFCHYVKVKDTDEITGYIENYANNFQHRFGTPIKCVKSEEVPDYPDELKERDKEEREETNNGTETD